MKINPCYVSSPAFFIQCTKIYMKINIARHVDTLVTRILSILPQHTNGCAHLAYHYYYYFMYIGADKSINNTLHLKTSNGI